MTASSRLARPSLPPVMRWIGPGLTAFAGSAGPSSTGRLADIGRPADLPAAFGRGGDPEFLRALSAYFAEGGGPCAVLNLPSPGSIPPANRASAWLGEDGGPGYRTGLFSFLDREDLGTIAAPGLLDEDLRRRLIAFIEKAENRFLVLDALPGSGKESLPACDRAAVVGERGEGSAGGPPPSGRRMAEIEACDFSVEHPERILRALSGKALPTLGTRFETVEAWRTWEGLRRSIDHGTRWIVFQPNEELLWRRVEREVGAFLGRLHRLGLLQGSTTGEAFRVRCEPPPAGDRSSEGLLVIQVEVRLKGTKGRASVNAAPAGDGAAPSAKEARKISEPKE